MRPTPTTPVRGTALVTDPNRSRPTNTTISPGFVRTALLPRMPTRLADTLPGTAGAPRNETMIGAMAA